VTILVSVLISVGVSAKATTRRIKEHHEANMDRQRNMTNMLEVMVKNMKLKELEVWI
jgi:Na+-transporting NADH:ubiquinone oxidoreductase subunit NqrC